MNASEAKIRKQQVLAELAQMKTRTRELLSELRSLDDPYWDMVAAGSEQRGRSQRDPKASAPAMPNLGEESNP